ncbi:MAG: malto-oligosyltrehalose synthase [Chloroflexota bacterium]
MRATYRVQLRKEFGFNEAAGLAAYLAELGVSHLYCSPYLQAVAGSAHGYDVVDHSRVNVELGGASAHARMCETLGRHHLGQVLDIVPNHMAIGGRENIWWWDILENGPSSRFASYFDVDWDPPEARLRNLVLLPILGDRYGRVLESGDLRVQRSGSQFEVRYFDRVFPVTPRSLVSLLARAALQCGSQELGFIGDSFSNLPLATATDRLSVARRHRDKEVLLNQLARLIDEEPLVSRTIDASLDELNQDLNALDALLNDQNYRLAFWRTAQRDLDYRRFFDVDHLIGLRTELDYVFADTHALVLQWLEQGVLDGVRIDHPDGLRDPEHYFQKLRQAAPRSWIVVEKILEPGERLRESWPVDGTVGYEFLNRVGGLFVDPDGEGPLTDFYAEFTGETTDYQQIMRSAKGHVLRDALGSDLNRLTGLLIDICEHHRAYRDYTRHELHDALGEVIVSLPVYRTYARSELSEPHADDARYLDDALARAAMHRPDLDPDLLAFLRDILLMRLRGDLEMEVAMRVQQLSGAVMAKGVEDTAFYNFNRLVSLNEVGGDPGQFGTSVDEFHATCAEAQDRWPLAMLTTATHDTKRGEDARVRISMLSEIPEVWRDVVKRWSIMNERYRQQDFPDRNAEYLFYQTLIGTWPITAQRAVEYMEKAARESKAHTSWTNPNEDYELALRRFVEGVLGDAELIGDLEQVLAGLIEPARITSLAQTLLKLTAPGAPDIYQGTEIWDLSLVDPDNRRPVDFDLRAQLLQSLTDSSPESIWAEAESGLPKLWVIKQALALRRVRPELFGPRGTYEPLYAQGARAKHLVAFVRGESAITIVPRLVIGLAGRWGDTEIGLPNGRWHNFLTGEHIQGGAMALAVLLRRFPVALLVKADEA